MLFERGFALHRVVLEAGRRAGFEPHVVAVSSQIDFIIELVAARLGVAFLPRMIAVSARHPAVRVVALEDADTEWHMALIWRRGAYLSGAAQAWLALVRETRETVDAQ